MLGGAHQVTTQLAFVLLGEINSTFPLLPYKDTVANESVETDRKRDLEFVDVEGGVGNGGRDNPHKDETWAIDDKHHYKEGEYFLTTFNHFIDIKKGPGKFDDFDGYSYEHGSAKKDQYQRAEEALQDPIEHIILYFVNEFLAAWPFLPTVKVDEGLNWWLNDEYVHCPGHPWYRGCSPSVERYSYYTDKGIYTSIEAEAKKRFPLANSTGASGKGIPYSVFIPVDNMARYWFASYEIEKIPECLGPVMHAIQDASIPHHAAGYNGNWHCRYEKDLNRKLYEWVADPDPAFRDDVRSLFGQWMNEDSSPPTILNQNDWNKIPCINWRIDMLVTWLALNAYHAYDTVYDHFRNGYLVNEPSMKDLTEKAIAMSMLALYKAVGLRLIPALARRPDESWFWLLH